MIQVLAVGDEALADAVAAPDFAVERVADLAAASDRAAAADCLVVDAALLGGAPLPSAVPVVAVGDGDAADAALEDGADDYVLADAPVAVLTQRVERAVERRRRQRRQRALFADASRPMGVFDGDGRLLEHNDAADAFVDETAVGERLWEGPWVERSPVAAADLRAAFDRTLEGETTRVDAEVRDAEGAVRSVRVELRPIHAAAEVQAVLAVGNLPETAADEPAGKGGPAALSQRLRTIVENVPVVLFAFDADGTFTLSEGKGLERLGLAPGELVGENVFDVYGDNEEICATVKRALDGEHVNAEQSVGDLVFETWYRPVVEDGAVTQVIGASIDVTERRERERELRQYETLMETVPDGVFIVDDDGYIQEGNEHSAEMFGYEVGELLDEPFARLLEDGVVDEVVVEKYEDALSELLSSDTDTDTARFELPVYRGDQRRIFESHVTLLPSDDGFRGVVGVNRDITERKRTERELRRQNERLEKLSSVVSHDLRNPLNVAMGTADLLAEDLDDDRIDDVREPLARMEELIEGLLQLARTGQSVTDPEHTPLAELAREAWSTVSSTDATLDLDLEYAAAVDRSRVRQLFENLFRNAVEHGGDGVTITVGDLDDGFYVADDGRGIPEAHRAEVFEYGFTTAEEGTGLGLAIVEEIAEAHGWTVDLAGSETSGVSAADASGGSDPERSEPSGARFEFRESLEPE